MARLTVAIALVLFSACGSSNGGSVSADQACTDVAQTRCNKRTSCTNGAGITRTFGDMGTCLMREKLQCSIALAAPMSANTPAQLEACVNGYATLSCADFLNGNIPVACIPTGPKAAGARCTFNAQCASTYCSNNKTSICGTCGSAPMAGSSCAMTNCERGQECVSITNLCEVPGTSGASCNTQNPCGPDFGCVGATQTMMGACMAANSMMGAACGTGMAPCDATKGLYCGGSGTSRTCLAIPYVENGMQCGNVGPGMFVGCAAGGNCYTAAGTIAMTGEIGSCKAAASDGAPCDTASGPPCLTPARCITTGGGTAGTCTVPDGTMCM